MTLRIVQSDLAATIGRFVVHEQQLKVLEVLREHAVQRLRQEGRGIVGGFTSGPADLSSAYRHLGSGYYRRPDSFRRQIAQGLTKDNFSLRDAWLV